MSTITTGFSEDLRYRYNLNENSRVIDCGFYKGDFAIRINEMYSCHVEAYEPITKFFNEGLVRILNHPKILLQNYGVSAKSESFDFGIKGDSTGSFADAKDREQVQLMGICDVINFAQVDLLKLNIEGMEFYVLDRLIRFEDQRFCKNIQVQFHAVFPDAVERHRKIREGLLKTHHLTYDFPFVWENYERID